MKLQNVIRVLSIFFIIYFVFVSIGLSMDITPTKSSDKITNSLNINEKIVTKIHEENILETDFRMSVSEHQNDALNLQTAFIESEYLSPVLNR